MRRSTCTTMNVLAELKMFSGKFERHSLGLSEYHHADLNSLVLQGRAVSGCQFRLLSVSAQRLPTPSSPLLSYGLGASSPLPSPCTAIKTATPPTPRSGRNPFSPPRRTRPSSLPLPEWLSHRQFGEFQPPSAPSASGLQV
jgi:hypothetical protein